MDQFPSIRSATSAPPIALLGVPFDNVTTVETIVRIEQMVASGQPHHLVTANVDFLVQAMRDIELRRILLDAHLVLCDGTPLLWASRWLGNPLPERVAGSDLVPLLIQIASEKKYKVFFLGGSAESMQRAIQKLKVKYPALPIAGHYAPPFAELLDMDHDEIKKRITEAKPDLLFVSFGCPKQEKWIAMHYRSLGVPVSVGVGGTIDFLAGTTKRAPRWMQRAGLEWTFRLAQEPRRLLKRYVKDLFWFSLGLSRQWSEMRSQPGASVVTRTETVPRVQPDWQRIRLPCRLDLETVRRDALICEESLANSRHCLLELNNVSFIDSTGVGLLIRLQKKARITGRRLILVAPSQPVRSALKLMRLEEFFTIAHDNGGALKIIEHASDVPVTTSTNYFQSRPGLSWRGEVTAANADQVWQSTSNYICANVRPNAQLQIDLSALRFIDSAGVGLMIRAQRSASSNGIKLQFIGIQQNVRNVLRMAKLETALLGEAA